MEGLSHWNAPRDYSQKLLRSHNQPLPNLDQLAPEPRSLPGCHAVLARRSQRNLKPTDVSAHLAAVGSSPLERFDLRSRRS